MQNPLPSSFTEVLSLVARVLLALNFVEVIGDLHLPKAMTKANSTARMAENEKGHSCYLFCRLKLEPCSPAQICAVSYAVWYD